MAACSFTAGKTPATGTKPAQALGREAGSSWGTPRAGGRESWWQIVGAAGIMQDWGPKVLRYSSRP